MWCDKRAHVAHTLVKEFRATGDGAIEAYFSLVHMITHAHRGSGSAAGFAGGGACSKKTHTKEERTRRWRRRMGPRMAKTWDWNETEATRAALERQTTTLIT